MITFKKSLSIRQLRLMESLGRTLSVSRTAEQLHTSQSTISRGLRELEELLDTVLFDRTTRHLRPTVLGRNLIRHADQILNQLDRAEADFYTLLNGSGEQLSVGLMAAVSPRLLSTAIARLEQRVPNVSVRFHSNFAQDLAIDLIHNRHDLIISHFDIGHFDNMDALSVNVLYSDQVAIAAAIDHPLAAKNELTWEDLANARWALVPSESSTRRIVERKLLTYAPQRKPVIVESIEIHVILELIRSAGMITALPRHFVHWLQHDLGLVRRLPLADTLGSWSICTATLASREPSRVSKFFLDCLEEASTEEQKRTSAA